MDITPDVGPFFFVHYYVTGEIKKFMWPIGITSSSAAKFAAEAFGIDSKFPALYKYGSGTQLLQQLTDNDILLSIREK